MSGRKAIDIITPLYPLSWIYGGITKLRNKLFDHGILRSRSFDIPTICIGNLSVGGTGKTPHTEYLIKLLRPICDIAVLSRGYKRNTKGYILADNSSDARAIGDEPYQMKLKFPDIRVAVDEKRCHGIEQLLQLSDPAVGAVLLDDAYQHRYVKAGLYILLTDYSRLFCDDAILPAGRLRESAIGKQRADIVIVTKCPEQITAEECESIACKLRLSDKQELYFSYFSYANLYSLYPTSQPGEIMKEISHKEIEDKEVLLLTGIASPTPLVNMLSKYALKVDTMSFADHHDFNEKDIRQIIERFSKLNSERRIIITTEKDATRIKGDNHLIDSLKQHIFVQPIEVKFLQKQQEIFNQHIIGYVTENTRDSCVSKRAHAHQP
jgi:tetraacyldisaccharide 4'-kinase